MINKNIQNICYKFLHGALRVKCLEKTLFVIVSFQGIFIHILIKAGTINRIID